VTNEQRLSIGGLAKESKITVRTIRYYVSKGLLPPPVEKGSYGFYNQGHLDRLELIATLKDTPRMRLEEIKDFIESFSEKELEKILETVREIGMSPVHERVSEAGLLEGGPQVVERLRRSGYSSDAQPLLMAGAPNPGEDEVLDQLAASASSSASKIIGDDHWIRKELVEGVELHYKAGASEEMQIAIDNIVASGRSGLTKQRNREKSPGSKKHSRFFHRKNKQGEK